MTTSREPEAIEHYSIWRYAEDCDFEVECCGLCMPKHGAFVSYPCRAVVAALRVRAEQAEAELATTRAECERLHGSIEFFAQRFLAVSGQFPTAESGTSAG